MVEENGIVKDMYILSRSFSSESGRKKGKHQFISLSDSAICLFGKMKMSNIKDCG
jgi:hypothetical protein